MKYLKNGGMPGIFGIKDQSEQINAFQDWIELTAQRDAVNFKNVKIEPYSTSTGKAQYLFCDVGFLNYYESNLSKKLKTWLLQEMLAQISYTGNEQNKLYFYRSPKGKIIDLIICKNEVVRLCIKLIPEEKTTSKDYELLRAFKTKNQAYFDQNSKLVALTGTLQDMKDQGVQSLSIRGSLWPKTTQ